MKPYRGIVEDWSTTGVGDPYTPPELRGTAIQGKVNGRNIRTSPVVKVNKKRIETENSVYDLGQPSTQFVEWMKEKNIQFDPENPIRTVKKLTVIR